MTSNQGIRLDPADNQLNGARKLPFDRDVLGRMTREAWVRWAESHQQPSASWLVPYENLDETEKEANRQMGENVARWTLAGDAARFAMLYDNGKPVGEGGNDAPPKNEAKANQMLITACHPLAVKLGRCQ